MLRRTTFDEIAVSVITSVLSNFYTDREVQLAELTGRRPESVLGLQKNEDGWKVTVEVVELTRVPNSTDLLGCYVVALDGDGELVGYERVRRYQRGQVGGDEQ